MRGQVTYAQGAAMESQGVHPECLIQAQLWVSQHHQCLGQPWINLG